MVRKMRLKKRYSKIPYYSSNLIDNLLNLSSSNRIETSLFIPNIGTGKFLQDIGSRFPIVIDSLKVQKKNLGEISSIKILKTKNTNIYFCQLHCNRTNKTSLRNIDYEYFFKSVVTLKNFCLNIHLSEERRVEMHCPKLSLCSSGARWNTIFDIIEDCWSNNGIHTFIYRND